MNKLFIILITAFVILTTGFGFEFYKDTNNELGEADLIRVSYPQPNSFIESPLEIKGEARGYWFFEADFPIILTNWDGLIIAETIASAQSNWMTEDFIPFTAVLEFEKPEYGERGFLIFKDDALEFTVFFK